MSSADVGAVEAGRTCPYCRFPLKPDVPAVRCDACSSVYHRECWEEGGGCAILGCANAVQGAAGTGAYEGQPAPAPAPRRADAGARGSRSLLIGILAGVLLAGAAVTAFLLVHGSTGNTSTKAPSTVAQSPPPAPPTSLVRGEKDAAAELADIVELSKAGRVAVVARRYDAAIANRRDVLARLRSLSPRTARVERAKAAFTRAMEMSLQSDERYANGLDATGTDKAATRLKRRFVRLFDPIAADYGLESFSADDI
jgi:Prokaryotic RING finger family 1